MKLCDVVQDLVKTSGLTPEVEGKINQLLWTDLDKKDMQALEQLIQYLTDGTIQQNS